MEKTSDLGPLRSSPRRNVSKATSPSPRSSNGASVASTSPSKARPVRGSQVTEPLEALRSALDDLRQPSTPRWGCNSGFSSRSLTPAPSSTDSDGLAITAVTDMSTSNGNGPRAQMASHGTQASDTSLDDAPQEGGVAKEDLSTKDTDRPVRSPATQFSHDDSASSQKPAASASLLGKLPRHALAGGETEAKPPPAWIDAVSSTASQGGAQMVKTEEKIGDEIETVTVVAKAESTTRPAEIAQAKKDLVTRTKRKERCSAAREHLDNRPFDGPASGTRAQKRRCQDRPAGTKSVSFLTDKMTRMTRQRSTMAK